MYTYLVVYSIDINKRKEQKKEKKFRGVNPSEYRLLRRSR